jgi:hypothetical protein
VKDARQPVPLDAEKRELVRDILRALAESSRQMRGIRAPTFEAVDRCVAERSAVDAEGLVDYLQFNCFGGGHEYELLEKLCAVLGIDRAQTDGARRRAFLLDALDAAGGMMAKGGAA